MNNVKLFIDCEFNGFGGELISMALVSDQGDEFYEVLEPTQEYVPFVRDNVVPVLNHRKRRTPWHFQTLLSEFLNQYDSVHVVADWFDDIKYLCQWMIIGPGEAFHTPKMTFEVNRDIDKDGKIPHNALEDARAIMEEYYNQKYK